MVYIYTLSSSEFPEIVRYVGKTKDVKDRLRRHIGKHYLNSGIDYKNNWIKSEILKGNKILINQIEVVEENTWQDREKYWISFYKENGYKLTNSTIGGDGIKLNEDILEKRIKTRIKNTSEKYKDYIEKYKIRQGNNLWMADRECISCGKIVHYKSKKRSSLISNLKRCDRENRICNTCKSSGERCYFYGRKINDGRLKQEKYGKKILQLDLDENLIEEFNSIREASIKTGIDRKSISNCAKGIKSYNTAGGYKFKIKDI